MTVLSEPESGTDLYAVDVTDLDGVALPLAGEAGGDAAAFDFDFLREEVDRGLVRALGDDDVGVLLGGCDELFVHRFDRVEVLLDDALEVATAFDDVPLNAPDDPDVGVGLDVEPQVQHLVYLLVGEREDPLEDDHVRGFDPDRLVGPVVDLEVVGRHLDGLALEQRRELPPEEVPLKRGGVVVVDVLALFERQVALIFVVVVDRNPRDGVADVLRDETRDRRLPRTGPARDPDDERGNAHFLRESSPRA